MIKYLPLILPLTGCTWNVQERALDLSSKGLDEAEEYVCITARVGAIRTRYAGRMDVYNDFCEQGEL